MNKHYEIFSPKDIQNIINSLNPEMVKTYEDKRGYKLTPSDIIGWLNIFGIKDRSELNTKKFNGKTFNEYISEKMTLPEEDAWLLQQMKKQREKRETETSVESGDNR